MNKIEMYELGRSGVRAEFQEGTNETLLLHSSSELRLILDRRTWLDLFQLLGLHVNEAIRADERYEIEWAAKTARKS